MRSINPEPLPSPEKAVAYPYTPAERRLVNAYCPVQVVGDPRTVRVRVEDRAEHATADETMVTTDVHDHAAGLRSYEGSPRSTKETYRS